MFNLNLHKLLQLKVKKIKYLAVFAAQLVEWSPPTPEVCSLNPVIGKLLYRTLFVYCQLY